MNKVYNFIGTLEAFWHYYFLNKKKGKTANQIASRLKIVIVLLFAVYLFVFFFMPIAIFLKPSSFTIKALLLIYVGIVLVIYEKKIDRYVYLVKRERNENNFFENEINYRKWSYLSTLMILLSLIIPLFFLLEVILIKFLF